MKTAVWKSHKSIFDLAGATGKLAGWRLRLMKYVFDIYKWEGVDYQAAGTILTLPTAGGYKVEVNDEIAVMGGTPAKGHNKAGCFGAQPKHNESVTSKTSNSL